MFTLSKYTSSKDDFFGVERLGEARGGIAADTTQPGHREESLVRKPSPSVLS